MLGKKPRVMSAPGKYVQGQNLLPTLGIHIRYLGKSVLVISDAKVHQLTGKLILDALGHEKIHCDRIGFCGECSFEEIERITKRARKGKYEVILGVGGGKALDTAKAVAVRVNAATAVVPTIAATDAPTSSVSVVYSKDGLFEKALHHPGNPELVVVDLGVIARAPVRFLVAGMGDALATWFEADATFTSGANNEVGGRPTQAEHSLAKLCFDILMEYGLSATCCDCGRIIS